MACILGYLYDDMMSNSILIAPYINFMLIAHLKFCNVFSCFPVTVARPEAVVAMPQLSHSVDVSQRSAGHHDTATDTYERHNSEVHIAALFICNIVLVWYSECIT